jgi:hypothetical protein
VARRRRVQERGQTLTEISDFQISEQPAPAAPSISPGVIALFLKEKGGPRPCEACGGQSWRAHREAADDASGAITFAKLHNTDMRAVAPAVLVYCDACGLVRTFLRSIIAAWVEARRHG